MRLEEIVGQEDGELGDGDMKCDAEVIVCTSILTTVLFAIMFLFQCEGEIEIEGFTFPLSGHTIHMVAVHYRYSCNPPSSENRPRCGLNTRRCAE